LLYAFFLITLNIVKTIKVKEETFIERKGRVKVKAGVLSSESLESKDILYYLLELSLVRLLHIDLLSKLNKEKSSD
jgi:hypothetical protein